MTACDFCNGRGIREDADGNESVCGFCCGLGYPDAADMLATLIVVRDADRLAKACGQPGMATALRARIAKTIATVANFSTERFAEIRAKGMVQS